MHWFDKDDADDDGAVILRQEIASWQMSHLDCLSCQDVSEEQLLLFFVSA